MRLFSAQVKHLATSLLTVGLVLVFTSAPAFACKGDNGDVKVHSSSTSATDQRDEPKVCEFYLDAFNFDSQQNVNWHITEDTHGATALSGNLTLDQDGHGVTSSYKLTDGQYKLYWNFDGQNGSAKHKVFKVECEPTPCPAPTPTPKPTPCPKPVPTPCPKPVPTPTPTPTTPPVVGRGGGEVLSAATTTPAPAATLPNTGVSTLTTTLLALLILGLTAGIVSYRPKQAAA